jgi:hypothetical protein
MKHVSPIFQFLSCDRPIFASLLDRLEKLIFWLITGVMNGNNVSAIAFLTELSPSLFPKEPDRCFPVKPIASKVIGFGDISLYGGLGLGRHGLVPFRVFRGSFRLSRPYTI